MTLDNENNRPLLFASVSGLRLGQILPNAHAKFQIEVLPLEKGIQPLSGIRITDTFLKRTYEMDNLAQIHVNWTSLTYTCYYTIIYYFIRKTDYITRDTFSVFDSSFTLTTWKLSGLWDFCRKKLKVFCLSFSIDLVLNSVGSVDASSLFLHFPLIHWPS